MVHNTHEDAVDSPDSMPAIMQEIIATMGGAATAAETTPPVRATRMERPPFGGKISYADLERAHPYRLAELVDPAAIETFYDMKTPAPHTTWAAWRELELHTRGPSHRWQLSRAAEHLAAICKRYDPGTETGFFAGVSESELEAWYDAAVTLSAIPSVVERVLRGRVTSQTAKLVYHSLVNKVLTRPLKPGDRAEALVFALGARAAANGELGRFLHLGSPRESVNEYHNGGGQVFNHDVYELDYDERAKTPIEVKLHSRGKTKRRSHYDDAVVFLPALDVLARPILGEPVDLHTGRERLQDQVGRFLEKATLLVKKEVEQDTPISTLNHACEALAHHIDYHRHELHPRYKKPSGRQSN
jgi:hypothetical protein